MLSADSKASSSVMNTKPFFGEHSLIHAGSKPLLLEFSRSERMGCFCFKKNSEDSEQNTVLYICHEKEGYLREDETLDRLLSGEIVADDPSKRKEYAEEGITMAAEEGLNMAGEAAVGA
eukprot:Awhi_evm1s4362